MLQAFINLFRYVWADCLKLFGTNNVAIILSASILPLSILLQIGHKWFFRRNKEMTFKNIVKASFPQALIYTVIAYIFVGIAIFSWRTVIFVYENHENLTTRITELNKEINQYKQEITESQKEKQLKASDEKRKKTISELRTESKKLIDDIVHFQSQYSLFSSPPTTLKNRNDAEERWKQNVYSSKLRDSQFTNLFHQRIIDIAYKYHKLKIISDEELRHLLWISKSEYPTIDWILEALQKYNARLD